MTKHFMCLERMYASAPINNCITSKMILTKEKAVVEIAASEQLFHAANAVHGSIYFKALDDAAFFAAQALEEEFVVVTTSFTTYLTRPVSTGTLRAIGTVANQNKSQFIAEAVVYDAQDREVGRGNGIFVRSKNRLADIPAYAG